MTKLGAYIGFPDIYNSQTQAAATSQWNSLVKGIGQTPTMMLTYVDKEHPVSQWISDQQWASASWKATPWLQGVTPIIGLPMAGLGQDSNTAFRAIASGAWDSTINGIFKAWSSAGYTNLYLRPGWEMNGDWYSWGVTNSNATNFVAAFQHIADLAHNFSGAQIKVVWNPNVGDPSNMGVPVTSYYPGDKYVDIVALDIYGSPIDTNTVPGNASHGSSDFTLGAAVAFAKAHNKPFALGETGGTDASFPTNLAKVVAAAGVTVDFVGLWHMSDGFGNLTWSQNATTAAAWRNAFSTISSASDAAGGIINPPPPDPDQPVPPDTGTVTPQTLSLLLSEDSWRGDAKFVVSMDGKQLGSGTVTREHDSGRSQRFNFSGNWTGGNHDIKIDFINDAYGGSASRDRNLYVDQVRFNGVGYLDQSKVLFSNGSITVAVRSDP